MNEPLDEVNFLSNSANRYKVLRSLSEKRQTRHGLVEETSASRPTIGRILGEFEKRNWVKRDGERYSLTSLGRVVMEAFTDCLQVMETELKLRTAVRWLPAEEIGLNLGWFANANVTTPEPGSSHRPINRFIELLEGANSARGFGIATLAPMSAEMLLQKAASGMDTVIIYPTTVLVDNLMSTPDAAEEAVRRGHLTPLIHDDLPFGLYIFDDQIILGGYNQKSGVLRVVVDTDHEKALAWAEDTFEEFRNEADPFDLDTHFARDGWNSSSEVT